MLPILLRAIVIALGLIGPAMSQERILISSDWGNVTAELADNDAARSLLRMLPVTIAMRDHLRQEKTGDLPPRCRPSLAKPPSQRARWVD